METKDSVGNILNDGDTVIVTKTLKEGIRLKTSDSIDDSQNIECRIGKSLLVIKTQFIKRV